MTLPGFWMDVGQPKDFLAGTELYLRHLQEASPEMLRHGDANASIPTTQPVTMKPMFGALGKAVGMSSVAFVSKLCVEKEIAKGYGISKRIIAVENTRNISKKDMKLNDALPKISVDPQQFVVTADGKPLLSEPAKSLPLTKRYYMM
jgi:urease alpha subunit